MTTAVLSEGSFGQPASNAFRDARRAIAKLQSDTKAGIKFGIRAGFSAIATVSAMAVVGIAMNCAFN